MSSTVNEPKTCGCINEPCTLRSLDKLACNKLYSPNSGARKSRWKVLSCSAASTCLSSTTTSGRTKEPVRSPLSVTSSSQSASSRLSFSLAFTLMLSQPNVIDSPASWMTCPFGSSIWALTWGASFSSHLASAWTLTEPVSCVALGINCLTCSKSKSVIASLAVPDLPARISSVRQTLESACNQQCAATSANCLSISAVIATGFSSRHGPCSVESVTRSSAPFQTIDGFWTNSPEIARLVDTMSETTSRVSLWLFSPPSTFNSTLSTFCSW